MVHHHPINEKLANILFLFFLSSPISIFKKTMTDYKVLPNPSITNDIIQTIFYTYENGVPKHCREQALPNFLRGSLSPVTTTLSKSSSAFSPTMVFCSTKHRTSNFVPCVIYRIVCTIHDDSVHASTSDIFRKHSR